MIILTGMDYTKKSLQKFDGDQVSNKSSINKSFKLDPTYLIENKGRFISSWVRTSVKS